MNKLTNTGVKGAIIDSKLVRAFKKREIFKLLLSGDMYSQADLSKMLGYSKATVLSIIREFKDSGLVEERKVGKSKPVGGKRPTILGVRREGVYLFQVAGNLLPRSGRNIQVSLITLTGKKIQSKSIPIGRKSTPEKEVGALIREINRQKAALHKKEPDANVLSIAVAVGGGVDPVEGKLASSREFFKEFVGVPLKTMLEEGTGLQTIVEDTAVFPAYQEYYMGAAADHRSFVYLKVLPFVRAILFINGFIYRGERMLAGQIGASMGRMGNCQNEYLCDLIDHEIFGLPLMKDRDKKLVDLNRVYDFAKTLGVTQSRTIEDKAKLDRLSIITGHVIVNLICYYDVSCVVLGGVPKDISEEFRSSVLREVKKSFYLFNELNLDIRFAEDSDRDNTIGFVCVAAENMFYK